MKKFAFAVSAFAVQSAFALGIASGNTTGTNYPMVEDIVQYCNSAQVPIENITSAGSVENLQLVLTDKRVQFGIVQADAAYLEQQQDPKKLDKLKMVFAFFPTEVHVIVPANSPIRNIRDLANKRVVIGPVGSGSAVTAQVMQMLLGIQWQPLNMSQSDGFNAIMSNQADAEIIVAGAPVSLLQQRQGYRLIPINDPAILQFALYHQYQIAPNTYPNQQQPIPTFMVDNMLVTFAYAKSYQREIGDLVSCITTNHRNLMQGIPARPGGKIPHPKWRSVNPIDITRIKWPAHPIAVKTIQQLTK